MNDEAAKSLRAEFAPETIGKLPRITCKACSESRTKVCAEHRKEQCDGCGGYLTIRHIHLDYVGHAAVTDRLLQVDPEWTWEPVAFGADGTPLILTDRSDARMWIKLTIAGTTRFGVGIAPANSFELEKQLISDAIRNAAMRYGVALDLWSKEDLSHDEPTDESGTDSANTSPADEGQSRPAGPRLATAKQRLLLSNLIEMHTVPDGCPWPLTDDLSMRDCSRFIDELKKLPEVKNERVGSVR